LARCGMSFCSHHVCTYKTLWTLNRLRARTHPVVRVGVRVSQERTWHCIRPLIPMQGWVIHAAAFTQIAGACKGLRIPGCRSMHLIYRLLGGILTSQVPSCFAFGLLTTGWHNGPAGFPRRHQPARVPRQCAPTWQNLQAQAGVALLHQGRSGGIGSTRGHLQWPSRAFRRTILAGTGDVSGAIYNLGVKS
jgi:hypothetical protein